ncbi:MAG: transglycosylase domain-containing protein [Symbiobacteriia bacterium]
MSVVSRTERKTKTTARRIHWGRLLFVSVLGVVLLVAGAGATFFFMLVRDLPSLDELGGLRPQSSSIVYDVNGKEIRNLYSSENRVPIKLQQMPKDLQDAVVAIEDHRFRQHHGVDFRGIARAIWVDVSGGGLHEGASTITQQLAGNAFLNRQDKTLIRKAKEAVYALELERRYTKDEILEAYLNQVPFGHGAYGVEAAAKIYFGKDLTRDTLTLSEAALLAGLPQAPEGYSPYNNPKGAVARQNEVLNAMVDYGYVDAATANKARLTYDPGTKTIPGMKLVGLKQGTEFTGDWFVDYILQQLVPKYGETKVYQGGLRIYTTLDLDAQRVLDQTAHTILDKDFPIPKDRTQAPLQVAGIFVDAKTGGIRAMLGGRVHDHALGLNRAIPPSKPGAADGALRQPGSSIKPLVVYSPAIESGLTAGTVFDDSPTFYNMGGKETQWPDNWDGKFNGLMTLRQAITNSVNVIAVRILNQLGPAKAIEYADKFGIPTVKKGYSNDVNLAIALGGMTRGVSVLDMVGAYTAFPNLGTRQKPYGILKITDSAGNVLEEAKPIGVTAIKPDTAYIMVDMMKDVVLHGTAGQAALPGGRPAAGKTGTTSDFKDAWFMGYTKQIVGGVWLGYDRPRPMKGVYGGMYPARIWHDTVAAMSAKLPVQDWQLPSDNFVRVPIDIQTGLLPSPLTPPDKVRQELFIKGTEPTADNAPGAPMRQAVNVSSTNPNTIWDGSPGSGLPVPRVGLVRAVPWRPTADGKKPADWDQEVPTITYAQWLANQALLQPGATPGAPTAPDPGQPTTTPATP